MERDVDVIVVGAGGCGLTAAIAAAESGATVALLEKEERAGGNTWLSTGSVPAANSRFQREAGVNDSPEIMEADLLKKSGPHDAVATTKLLARESASLVEWLVDEHQVDLQLIIDYKHVGHSITRLHAPAARKGEYLVNDLVAAAERLGVDVVTGNPVAGLLIEDGAVVGVRVAGERIEEYEIRAGAVVLAANGFGGNRDMLRKWIPEIADAEYFGAHGSTGEAITWAGELGSSLSNMNAYQGYAAVAYPHGSIVSWTTVEMGACVLSPAGGRMGDESVGYSAFAPAISAVAKESWVVLDQRICDYVQGNEEEFADLVEIGGISTAADAAAVANIIGADAAIVEATLSEYSQIAHGQKSDPFGRTDFGFGPLVAPYCVIRSVPALFHTQGGVAVTDTAAVSRPDGTTIPGLFAGGGVAAGISGKTGASGYSSGNGLLTAVGYGRIAGLSAAAAAQ
ncbi:FAD-dependent oxidoreductase [Brevibacterium aurantiacum]|uniref:Fumarate reductase flavoprotein subunit n=1 Tax=Brevibacterium aurantiacum TaxID=273384 RepID=A0A2H1KMN5_BREAU|nr:FAD-dependent oxidoreductase [Brevibacterium aurantiacum]SMY01000.1 fumarate reductase flavoprotein subunit [Brevibacterium aurantiacum]